MLKFQPISHAARAMPAPLVSFEAAPRKGGCSFPAAQPPVMVAPFQLKVMPG